jgi:hypothetical protein
MVLALIFFSIFKVSAQEYTFPGTYIPSKENCSNTDIRQTNPKIKNSSKLTALFSTPRNQGPIGWCYAFTASDLISVEMGKPVSALHASTIHNRQIFNTSNLRATMENRRKAYPPAYDEVYEGGDSDEVIRQVQKQSWICSEDSLPSNREKTVLVDELIWNLEQLKKESHRMVYQSDHLCSEVSNVLKPFNLSSADVDTILTSALSDDLNLTMDQFVRSACTEKLKNIPEMKVRKVKRPEFNDVIGVKEYMNEINSALEKGKPISFDYNLAGIKKGSDGLHASVIMGRRWKNGKCEYKVRNSWGDTCLLYLPEIECNKSEGAYWLSAEKLFSSSNNFTYISN